MWWLVGILRKKKLRDEKNDITFVLENKLLVQSKK